MCLDPYDVIRLFPNLLPQYLPDDSSSSDNQTTPMGNRDSDKSLQALINYLTEVFETKMWKIWYNYMFGFKLLVEGFVRFWVS